MQVTAPVQTVPVTAHLSFGDSVRLSLTNALSMVLSAIPRILGFIVILLIGWFIASLIGKALLTVLRAIRFNDVAERTGITGFVQKMRSDGDPSELVAGIGKWLVRVVVLLMAFDALGLPGVSDVLRQFLLWLPNLVIALVVLIIAGIAARALGNIVRGATAEAGFSNPETLANVAKTAVWAFAIIIAVDQVGIASTLINTLFMGLVGALALASGLAFGLGGRDLAGNLLDNWYGQAPGGKTKVRHAAKAAADDLR